MSESPLTGKLTHLLHETPIFDELAAAYGYDNLINDERLELKPAIDTSIQTLRKNLGLDNHAHQSVPEGLTEGYRATQNQSSNYVHPFFGKSA